MRGRGRIAAIEAATDAVAVVLDLAVQDFQVVEATLCGCSGRFTVAGCVSAAAEGAMGAAEHVIRLNCPMFYT